MAVKAATKALEKLGKEDLLFCHHGTVIARLNSSPTAYQRLADLFQEYATAYAHDQVLALLDKLESKDLTIEEARKIFEALR